MYPSHDVRTYDEPPPLTIGHACGSRKSPREPCDFHLLCFPCFRQLPEPFRLDLIARLHSADQWPIPHIGRIAYAPRPALRHENLMYLASLLMIDLSGLL